ncbi:MAG: DUF4243 domain-containing protein [Actinobacteria bacterium]|nr:DUF4243 domain-containing protein [Actinomycetota bacterium]
MTDHDVLDDALDVLAPYGPEWHNGLSSHGPMAAEALLRMGRTEAVMPWVQRYVAHLAPAPPVAAPLADDERLAALGHHSAYPAWLARFRSELAASPPDDVLARWAPVLAPGLFGAACHGVLRAAHATRALTDHLSPQRVDELARGLAYWSARYQTLPGRPTLSGGVQLADALHRVGALELPSRGGWLITEVLAPLPEVTGFAGAVEALEPTSLSAVTATFARAYLAVDASGVIPLVHAVTGPTCLRSLLSHLPADAQPVALGAAWQAAAALYLGWGERGLATVDPSDARGLDADELADRAVASGDEHAIKLTEACLREHAIVPDPVYLLAAADVCERLRA